MEHRYTVDDAVVAAEALREISVGHAAILDAAGLGGLSNDELKDPCAPVRRRGLSVRRSRVA